MGKPEGYDVHQVPEHEAKTRVQAADPVDHRDVTVGVLGADGAGELGGNDGMPMAESPVYRAHTPGPGGNPTQHGRAPSGQNVGRNARKNNPIKNGPFVSNSSRKIPRPVMGVPGAPHTS